MTFPYKMWKVEPQFGSCLMHIKNRARFYTDPYGNSMLKYAADRDPSFALVSYREMGHSSGAACGSNRTRHVMTVNHQTEGAPTRGQFLQLLIHFAFTRIVLNTMHRMVYPFLPAFARGLKVDTSAVTFALTARSAIGAAGSFLAWVADHQGRKVGMTLGLLIFLAGTGILLIRSTFAVFLASLILTILAKDIFDPSMQAYLGDRVPYSKRGSVIAATEVSWSLSFIAGVPLMGYFMARYGWRSPFVILFILCLFCLGLLLRMVPRDRVHPVDRQSLWASLVAVLSHGPALAGLGLSVMVGASNEVINLVFGIWLEETFALNIAMLGAASAVIGVSELGGEALVGILTDRIGKRRAIGIGILLNSLAALTLSYSETSLIAAVAALSLVYVTFEFAVVSMIPLMTELVPTSRATLMAGYVASMSLGRALGAAAASLLFHSGIRACALAAVTMNILAGWFLGRLKKSAG
jgi:predicted MFS family arabinose efflux permease